MMAEAGKGNVSVSDVSSSEVLSESVTMQTAFTGAGLCNEVSSAVANAGDVLALGRNALFMGPTPRGWVGE